jgi:hypothetical protein
MWLWIMTRVIYVNVWLWIMTAAIYLWLLNMIYIIFVNCVGNGINKKNNRLWSFCRVPKAWHSINWPYVAHMEHILLSVRPMTLGKLTHFAECQPPDTRQTLRTLPSVSPLTLSKITVRVHPLTVIFAVCRIWHSAKGLPSVRVLTLGKAMFAGFFFAERPVPSATLGKRFAECLIKFAECFRHSANTWFPVVYQPKTTFRGNSLLV